MTTKPRKAPILTKRYNQDGSVSLLGYKNRVVYRAKTTRDIIDGIPAFAEGWFGDLTPNWGRTQFRGKRN